MKSKKSGIPILSALLRIIIAIVLVFIFFVACSKVKNAFSNEDDKVINDFEEFANGINDMSSTAKSFEMEFKKGSAIVGFRKGASAWDCHNCHTTHASPTRAFIKPSNDQCVSSACMCLCLEGFLFEGGANKLAKCGNLICKGLKKGIKEKDIKETTIIKSSDKLFSNDDTYWKNGFLFVNGIEEGAGSGIISISPVTLFVDNNNGVVSVCTKAMRENNQKMFGNDRCTTPP